MSSVAVVQLAMGYQRAQTTTDCGTCAHAEPEPRPYTWRCIKGGFVTNNHSVCTRHRQAALIQIGPLDV